MNRIFKLLAVVLVLFGMSSAENADAFSLTYYLQVSQNTWALKAKTDAPGGIASIAVNLAGVATGVSVAPRGDAGGGIYVKGFTQGNIFAASQAFAGQQTAAAASTVKQVGFADVPEASFTNGIFTMVGSGIRDAQGFVTFYTGTNSSPYSAQYADPRSPQSSSGTVWADVTATKPITVGVDRWIQGPSGYLYVADFNGDFNVDGADFVIWQTHSPTPTGATRAIGDADSDGDVDDMDLVVWQNFFPAVPTGPTPPVPNPPPGDFDADGDIDGFDFIVWQSNVPLATGGTRAKGDADADGDVDTADWQIWLANFPTQPAPGPPPVPEPQSFLIATLGFFGCVWIKRSASRGGSQSEFDRQSRSTP